MALKIPNIVYPGDNATNKFPQVTLSVDQDGNYAAPTSTGGTGTPTGSAGSPNAAVVTVQGIANGTPQPVADALADAALGTPTDTPWTSGAGTLVALGKRMVGLLAGTLTATINGALPAGTNAIGSVIASGASPVGSPPGVPPVPVSGVDSTGNKQHLLTDTAGRQVVSVANGALAYAAPTTGSVTTAPSTTNSAPLIAAGTYANLITITTAAASTGNVFLGFAPAGTANAAAAGSGFVAFAGGGSVTLSRTGPLPMPAANQAIYAISDSGTVAVSIQGA